MAMASPMNPINYIINRQYNDSLSVRNNLFTKRLVKATNLFRKDLYSHYGCVNAIEFSDEGELLISGGDDRRVLLWSVPNVILKNQQPNAMLTPHLSNIFCLGFDSFNSKIFSAGNDDQVIVHDLKTGHLLNNFLHEKPVYGLSVSPQNDNVYASAGEDGRILIYDIREPVTEPLCLAKYKTAFHAVMFNPIDPRFVATANTDEGIALWDNRKPKELLIKYGNSQRQTSGMSVRFNSLGTQLLALRRRLPPVLFALHSETAICQFYHPDYYNSCTMKSCSFAGENDEYVLSGSDDFNLYMWRIPKNNSDWGSTHMVLVGHRSIVNQVRYNRQNNVIASSGVEKMVKLWSTLPIRDWKGSLFQPTMDKSRQVFSHEDYVSLVQNNGQLVSHDYSHQSTQEDSRMMAFFDSLVQREIEGWVMTDDSLSSDSDYDSSSNLHNMSQIPLEVQRLYSSDKKHNRIAQLIYEKREKLARMAQQKSPDSNQRYKKQRKRKLKSSAMKSKRARINPPSTTTTRRRYTRQQTTSSSAASIDTNPPAASSRRTSERTPTKHKYKTRSHSARERDDAESLDMPSTSTGITASTSSVYRIYDQDSDEEPPTPSSENNNNNNTNNNQQLINILPTPLNGTHDMYINILEVPVQSSTRDNYESDSSENDSTLTTPSGRFQNCSEALTPDSGIVTNGPSCSSSGSVHLRNEENSDDPDWMCEEFKKRMKKARVRHDFVYESDSN